MKTVEDVKNWYADLARRGKVWHPEDNAMDVFGLKASSHSLQQSLELAWSICADNGVDICEIALNALKQQEKLHGNS